MQLNLIDPIETMLGTQVDPASDELLITLSTLIQAAAAAPDVLAWAGQQMPAVLLRWLEAQRENAQLRERALLASQQLLPCAPFNAPHDSGWCEHGSWPCRITLAAWHLSGLDPVAEQTRTRDAARKAAEADTPA